MDGWMEGGREGRGYCLANRSMIGIDCGAGTKLDGSLNLSHRGHSKPPSLSLSPSLPPSLPPSPPLSLSLSLPPSLPPSLSLSFSVSLSLPLSLLFLFAVVVTGFDPIELGANIEKTRQHAGTLAGRGGECEEVSERECAKKDGWILHCAALLAFRLDERAKSSPGGAAAHDGVSC